MINKISCTLIILILIIGACKKQDQKLPRAIVADRTSWTATADSYEKDDEVDPPSNVLDGDLTTYWHTQYSGYASLADSLAGNIDYDNFVKPFPHFITIDMKNAIHLISVDLITRQGNKGGFTNFMLEGSTDGTTWSSLGNFVFDPTIFTSQSFAVSSTNAYRYLKLTALKGNNPFTFLAELNVNRVQ